MLGDPGHVCPRRRRVDGRAAQLDPEQVARLVERGVRRLGLDHVGPFDATVLTGVLSVGVHRMEDAVAASAGDETGGRGVVDGVTVEHVEGHGDDLALELAGARTDVAL